MFEREDVKYNFIVENSPKFISCPQALSDRDEKDGLPSLHDVL